jgi:hypothetical protein
VGIFKNQEWLREQTEKWKITQLKQDNQQVHEIIVVSNKKDLQK